MGHLQHVHMTQIDRNKFIYSRKKIPPIPTSNRTIYKVCDPTRTHPYTKNHADRGISTQKIRHKGAYESETASLLRRPVSWNLAA